ncbi:MAG: hypothetical protein AB1765_10550 [Candidatus Hydrogenedentota bacterium]
MDRFISVQKKQVIPFLFGYFTMNTRIIEPAGFQYAVNVCNEIVTFLRMNRNI